MKDPEKSAAYTSAVALRWDDPAGAPRVTAKGQGLIADAVIELARRHDVPLRAEPALVDMLIRVELGDEIPHNLYVAVAEVIAFAYSLTGRLPPHRR